jgi:hypothetical protein
LAAVLLALAALGDAAPAGGRAVASARRDGCAHCTQERAPKNTLHGLMRVHNLTLADCNTDLVTKSLKIIAGGSVTIDAPIEFEQGDEIQAVTAPDLLAVPPRVGAGS